MRGLVERGDFIEIYCNTPIEICESRDVKGLYDKARAGKIAEFTGISSPYQAPENPELTVNTGADKLDTCVRQVLKEITNRGICALQIDPTLESECNKHGRGSGMQP